MRPRSATCRVNCPAGNCTDPFESSRLKIRPIYGKDAADHVSKSVAVLEVKTEVVIGKQLFLKDTSCKSPRGYDEKRRVHAVLPKSRLNLGCSHDGLMLYFD